MDVTDDELDRDYDRLIREGHITRRIEVLAG
jgi:hypothetical protein